MMGSFRNPWLVVVLVVAALSVWGCAPGPQAAEPAAPGASAAAADSSSYQDDLMPAASPAPVQDPEAPQTTVPGAHLDTIGTITSVDSSSITVDGVVYSLTSSTEIKGTLAVGGTVKLEYTDNADGSRTVVEAKTGEFFDESGGSGSDDG